MSHVDPHPLQSDDHDHDHDHDDHGGHGHDHGSELSEMALRVRALESLLIEKGYVEEAALDELVQAYEKRIGPRNGAMVVARSWTDPTFREWLLRDASAAIHSMGFTGRQGEHLVAVENTPQEHNMVVCTLCSCYPWPVLGLPPSWYKSPPYRARMVAEPRAVLREFGLELPSEVEVVSGTPAPRSATWWCRCGRRRPRAGARTPWPRSSPATA